MVTASTQHEYRIGAFEGLMVVGSLMQKKKYNGQIPTRMASTKAT